MTMLAQSALTLEPADGRNTRLTATITAGLRAWVFLDGDAVLSNCACGTALSMALPFPPTEAHAVEVHEAPAGSTIAPSDPAPRLRPSIRWFHVSGADGYRVYSAEVGGTSILQGNVGETGGTYYGARMTRELAGQGGRWHGLKVVARRGQSEGTADWAYSQDTFAMDMPGAASSMSIAGSGGAFTVTLA